MSATDTNTMERRRNGGNSVTWIAIVGGLAALAVFINGTEKYASLPRDLDRQQKQLDKLTSAVERMEQQYQADRNLISSIDGKVSVLLRESRLGNTRAIP